MSPVELLGLFAGGIGVFYGLPQARQVRKAGHSHGVSVSAWLLLFAMTALWSGYGVRIGSPSVTASNVVATAVNATVVIALLGASVKTYSRMAAAVVGILAFVTFMPESVVSAVLVVFVFGQAPQIAASFRSWRRGTDSVVSMPAMAVAITSLTSWEIYAILTDTGVMKLTTGLALSIVLTITTLELLARRSRAHAA